MSVFKCKMCGGSLEVSDDSVIAVCDYCGIKQTVPLADNDKKMMMFDRANKLRFLCEFDKAAVVYESIVSDFPYEAEAYWGLILCKYGIEYVDDPSSGKKVPTCHRSSFESVLEDENFEQVMENADPAAVSVYRDEAKAIENLRKNILEITSKEEPYDIFICYKETDEFGDRTIDSVIAQNIYDALTDMGYHVFFSRITLEDKLGVEYEPYIFAALHSAKIMLAVGTDYQHFNAVWVKNEWSRFLQLTVKGETKTLIPCYKDIDVYDMPKEFRHLQAQDMGKVGAIQDLIRGVSKIIPKQSDRINDSILSKVTRNSVTENSLIERAALFIEAENWKDADAYCEKALDINPQNGRAYFYKLMIELRVTSMEQLSKEKKPFDNRKNYQLTLRFSDEDFCERVRSCNRAVYERVEAEERRVFQEQETLLRHLNRTEELLRELQEKKDEMARLLGKTTLSPLCYELNPSVYASFHAEYIKKQEKILQSLGVFKSKEKRVLTELITREKELVKTFSTLAKKSSGSYYQLRDEMFEINNELHDLARMIKFHKQHMYTWRIFKAMLHYDYEDMQDNIIFDIIVAEKYKNYISVGAQHTLGLNTNGTVVATGLNNHLQCEVKSWRDIIAVSAGKFHSVALKKDGTVEAVGMNDKEQCDVDGWKDIVAISASYTHTVGLKQDGTVVAVGDKSDGRCNVSEWRDIVSISAGNSHTLGLKADGTIVGTGNNGYRQLDIEKWNNVVSIVAGDERSFALINDGTVASTFSNRAQKLDFSSWENIISFNSWDYLSVGIRKDNRIKPIYDDRWTSDTFLTKLSSALDQLYDIAYADIGYGFVIGLMKDGSLVSCGHNEYGACKVEHWKLW